MMDISIRQRDDVTIATLDGRLVAGVGDVELRTTLDRLVADGRRKILLDLSRVQRIDSSGIGELASGLRLAERFGSSMRLLNVDGQVLRILELSQLLPLFQVHGDEDEAIAAFDRASSSTASTVFDES